jgi:hypothetical protein
MVTRQPPSQITMCAVPSGGVDRLDIGMIGGELK